MRLWKGGNRADVLKLSESTSSSNLHINSKPITSIWRRNIKWKTPKLRKIVQKTIFGSMKQVGGELQWGSKVEIMKSKSSLAEDKPKKPPLNLRIKFYLSRSIWWKHIPRTIDLTSRVRGAILSYYYAYVKSNVISLVTTLHQSFNSNADNNYILSWKYRALTLIL